jgi:hypothetical protein
VIEAKGIETLCEVRHHKANAIGVRFLGPGVGAALARDLGERSERASHRNDDGTAIASVAPPSPKPVSGQDLRRAMFGK